MMDIIIEFIIDALFASIASVGFAMVFNVPKKTLLHCAIGGAIVLTSRNIFLTFDLNVEIAAFLASTIVGIIALYWSQKHKIPRPVYTVASIIPIIPGTYAIKATTIIIKMNSHGVTQEYINIFIENFLKSSSILGAISFGIALPSLYFKKSNKWY